MSMNNFISILTCIGGCSVVVIFVFVAYGLFHIIKDFIQVQIKKYKIRHRFDKSPTAKCYCIDCKNCQVEQHRGRWCYRFERCVADNWFCWEAEPNIKKGESYVCKY